MLTDAHLVALVATTDLERSRAFYGDVLGLHHVETTPYADVYDATGAILRVTLVQRVVPAPYTVLGWVVGDLDTTMDALGGRGVDFARFDGVDQDSAGVWTAPGGARIVWFRDPDGNLLSLTELAT